MNSKLGNGYEAFSAGTEPTEVNKYAVKVMQEIGIDISLHTSKGVDAFIDEKFDFIVTVCDNANEACPFFPGAGSRLHKGFEDPANAEGTEEEKLRKFRTVRNEIMQWILESFSKT